MDHECQEASQLIADVCDTSCTLFTGGPTHNLGDALQLGARIGRWVAQGGFCGVGVVPDGAPTLPQFAGKTHCATWNFGGSKDATLRALASDAIDRIVLVGKNVCHRCEYTQELHWLVQHGTTTCAPNARAMQLFHQAMEHYIEKSRNKKLHDPLAAMCAVDEGIVSLREVLPDRDANNSWGAVLCEGTGIFAAVDLTTKSLSEHY